MQSIPEMVITYCYSPVTEKSGTYQIGKMIIRQLLLPLVVTGQL
jgi:hypothetical protein